MWSSSGSATRRVALFGALLLLSACGFQPMYGQQNAATVDALRHIQVVGVQGEEAQRLSFILLDLFNASGQQPAFAEYRLEVSTTSVDVNVAIEQDAEVTRKNLIMRATYKLTDIAGDTVLAEGLSTSESSYNRVDSEFANIVAAEDAAGRTLDAVAREIKLRIGAYFSANPPGESS